MSVLAARHTNCARASEMTLKPNRRDSLFWASEMYIVNGEEIHIFYMPCEGCTPHTKVQIWCVDTRNLGVVSEKTRKDRREIGHVPILGSFREQ